MRPGRGVRRCSACRLCRSVRWTYRTPFGQCALYRARLVRLAAWLCRSAARPNRTGIRARWLAAVSRCRDQHPAAPIASHTPRPGRVASRGAGVGARIRLARPAARASRYARRGRSWPRRLGACISRRAAAGAAGRAYQRSARVCHTGRAQSRSNDPRPRWRSRLVGTERVCPHESDVSRRPMATTPQPRVGTEAGRMTRLRYTDELTGLLVLLAVLVLIGSILQAGFLGKLFQPTSTLRVLLPTTGSGGLVSGADVEVLGTHAGTIQRLVISSHQRM